MKSIYGAINPEDTRPRAHQIYTQTMHPNIQIREATQLEYNLAEQFEKRENIAQLMRHAA